MATLALIVERPGHGYELTSRLNRQLGPTWQIEPKLIYSILDDFAEWQLAVAIDEPNPDRPRQTRTVYHATDQAPGTLHHWMRTEVEVGPVRPDVIARISAASPGDAEELLRVLDDVAWRSKTAPRGSPLGLAFCPLLGSVTAACLSASLA